MSILSTGLSHDELHGGTPLTVTISTARKLSGLGNTTIWALIKKHELETVCVGRRRLVVYRSLQKLLSPPPTQPSDPRGRERRPRHHQQKLESRSKIGDTTS